MEKMKVSGEKNIMEHQPRFEIFFDKKKKYRFRLIAPNGEIICQSEAYNTKQACKDTIKVLPEHAKNAKIIDVTPQKKLCCEK